MRNSSKTGILSKTIMLICGAAYGITFMACMDRIADTSDAFGARAFGIVALILITIAAFYLHLIAHEFGHMLLGLASGYSFVSFRIGSHVFVKQHGSIRHKKFKIPGTSGQCIMAPPPYQNGRYPNVLYNLGGIIMNLLISAVSLAILPAIRLDLVLFRSFFIMMIVRGIGTALMNGVPCQAEVSNDGANVLFLAKDKAASRGFWLGLEIGRLQTVDGKRLKALDESLFEADEAASMQNPLASIPLVLREQRKMDCQDFDGAMKLIEMLLSESSALDGVSAIGLKLDRLYLDLLRHGAHANRSVLEEASTRKFMRAMKYDPSVIRTLYAVSLVQKREDEQAELSDRINRLRTTYVCPITVEAEMELMRVAESRLSL